MLYELIQNDTVIEKEKQDFPIKLYDEKYLQKKLFQMGFNHVEEIKSSESNEKFTIFKCIKGWFLYKRIGVLLREIEQGTVLCLTAP